MVVADVERPHARRNGLDELRIAVPEVVGSAIEMDVDQPDARHVPDEVALPAIDDQVDPCLRPEIGLAGIPELSRLIEVLSLGLDGEDVVVVHRPALIAWPQPGSCRDLPLSASVSP